MSTPSLTVGLPPRCTNVAWPDLVNAKIVGTWSRSRLDYPAFRFIHNISYQGQVPKLIRQMWYPCLYRAHWETIAATVDIVRSTGTDINLAERLQQSKQWPQDLEKSRARRRYERRAPANRITERNQVALGWLRKVQGRLVCIATAFQSPPLLTYVNV